MIKAPERFLREIFIPEYDEMVKTLHAHLTEVTERVVAEVLDPDRSEPAVVDAGPQQIEAFTGNSK